ncbi:MAG TPA: hypothetical protein VFX31_05950 [Ktedonobacterales bacterium]|nr:hypothetical protein [Ktedonobacterales bacterium]
MAADARNGASRDLDVHPETCISRAVTARVAEQIRDRILHGETDQAVVRVRAAACALRSVLQEERALIEAGDVAQMLVLRAKKQGVFEQWRGLITTLDPDTTSAGDATRLHSEAREIEVYARKSLDLMGELMIARSTRRGVC